MLVSAILNHENVKSIFSEVAAPSLPTEPFVSLTQAICKLTFGEWYDAATLRWSQELTADDDLYEAVRVALVDKTGHLTRTLGEGRIEVRGRLTSGRVGCGGTVPETIIPVEDLNRFRKFDLALDGLGLGQGLASPAAPDKPFRYDPSDEAYHFVRLAREEFLKEFFPAQIKRRGRPLGSGTKADFYAPHVSRMRQLVAEGTAKSASEAAWMVVQHVPGIALPESKVKSLKKWYNGFSE